MEFVFKKNYSLDKNIYKESRRSAKKSHKLCNYINYTQLYSIKGFNTLSYPLNIFDSKRNERKKENIQQTCGKI